MTVLIMLIFGIGLSVADLWQVYGRNVDPALPHWSLWEYFSGFIIGALIMAVFYVIPYERWQASDLEFRFFPADTPTKRFILYLFGHVFLFLYGIAESLNGLLNSSLRALQINFELPSAIMMVIIFIIDLPLYYYYNQGKFGQKFKNKEFKEKCLFLLIVLMPFFYVCYAFQFFLSGTFFNLEKGLIVTWIDTVSVIIAETYLLISYVTYDR
ncbi:MAG: hypothetical protein ACTSR8_07840 [Promethearchaeota archaeon]